MSMEHIFTDKIINILQNNFGKQHKEIFEKSLLIQYINFKTKSVNRDSKARASYANLYAIYVIIEDYIANGYSTQGEYSKYEGALYSNLLNRQRELPFGSKLQNHALNNRMNSEFQKFFPNSELIPIIRNLETNRYWINENLVKIKIGRNTYSLAKTIIEIIDEYIKNKQDAFQKFVDSCKELQNIANSSIEQIVEFINSLLAPNIDARLFEIVSYSILKYYYYDQNIYWGYEINNLTKENLNLFKTGRTNANDGGIDFVMKPLGRFFQVTETLDFKKYFLDIDKVQKYPISFVIKSTENIDVLKNNIYNNAIKAYHIEKIVDTYMNCIEEIINIPLLQQRLNIAIKQGYLTNILNEIILQSKLEFNYES
ncbi:MAG: restriction endonuclease [Ignavibacteria bacterium]|jgi:hypothetical protein|nr:restriction endonuclease [Ignavibacteria bacterium]